MRFRCQLASAFFTPRGLIRDSLEYANILKLNDEELARPELELRHVGFGYNRHGGVEATIQSYALSR